MNLINELLMILEYLDMTAVDRDAAAGLAKELRSVGFKVKLVNKDLSVEQ